MKPLDRWKIKVSNSTNIPVDVKIFLYDFLSYFKYDHYTPTIRQLCTEIGMSPQTVIKYIRIAERHKLLSVERGKGRARNKYNFVL